MKKWIVLGVVLNVLVLGAAFAYQPIRKELTRRSDCETLKPATKASESIGLFYHKLIEGTLTTQEALELANAVEKELPKIATVKLKNPDLIALFAIYQSKVPTFPANAREWAKIKPHPPADVYIRQRAEAAGGRGTWIEDAQSLGPIGFYCNWF